MTGDVGALRAVHERARPMVMAGEQLVPVIAPLAELFNGGGIRRGATVATTGRGARSLAFGLAVAPSAAGSWVAVVGFPHIGLAAAREMGVELGRVVVAEPSSGQWAVAVAALAGSVDLVLTVPPRHVKHTDLRRIQARVRERGTVLVSIGPIDGADITLAVTSSRWHGLGVGHGALQSRLVTIEATGRREAARPRRVEVTLPGSSGRIEVPAVESVTADAPWAGSDIDHLVENDPRPALHRAAPGRSTLRHVG